MAVTDVNKISSELAEEPTGHRQYDVLYEVITNDANDGPQVVRQASGLPKIGDQYAYGNDSDPFAACVSRGPFRIRSIEQTRKVWSVPLQYSSRPAEGSNPENNGKDNPVDWAWEVGGSFASYMKAVLKDRNGNAVVNAAGEPFIPAPEDDDPRMVLTLKKNTPSLNLATWSQFRGAVNADAIWGLQARMVRLAQWTFAVRRVGYYAYIENNYELHINWDKWNFEPLNQGFREKIGINLDGTPKYQEIVDARGQRVRMPHPLDAGGAKLLEGQPLIFYDGAAGLNPYEIAKEQTFADIFPAALPGPFITT